MMKNLIYLLPFVALVACSQQNSEKKQSANVENSGEKSQPKLVEIWATGNGLRTPESVLYHDGTLYVANINEAPWEDDGNGYISKLTDQGELIDSAWAVGLSAPKGMTIVNSKLYVADLDRVVAYALESGDEVERIQVPEAKKLNDVTSKGSMVYVSDSETGKIHSISEGESKVFAENFKGINGLLAEDQKLTVASGAGLHFVDYETLDQETINDSIKGGDGIIKYGQGIYLVSRWPGQVYYHSPEGTIKLLDTSDQKINSADLGFHLKERMVFVPTFYDNRVVAYRLDL